MDVSGKVALVTGGATGVGAATAIQLAQRGCAVAINYSRSGSEAEETVEALKNLGVPALAIRADVADDTAVRAMVDQVVGELGRLDVLVNSAGTTVFVPHPDLEKVQDEDWDRIFGVNVKGAFHCARAARAALEAGGNGAIVNISSVAGIAAVGSSIPYCASKAALNNLTISLARALAPKIRVNAVAPGAVQGRWLQQGWGGSYDRVMENVAQSVPLKRTCTPDDVAHAVLSFIVGSDLVTGQILVVDGGMLIRS
jgi:3-oxoacyl-[acyl-carrier protein] reductase